MGQTDRSYMQLHDPPSGNRDFHRFEGTTITDPLARPDEAPRKGRSARLWIVDLKGEFDLPLAVYVLHGVVVVHEIVGA